MKYKKGDILIDKNPEDSLFKETHGVIFKFENEITYEWLQVYSFKSKTFVNIKYMDLQLSVQHILKEQ